MCLGGKLGRRREQVSALGGLIFLQDSKTEQRFLVDTGAAVSVFPHKSSAPSSGIALTGADGKPIKSWGTVTRTLCFGLRTLLCTFILAAVSKPILGIDFLARHRLLVDPFARQVLDAVTLRPLGPAFAAAPQRSRLTAALCHIAPAVRSILSAFPSIVGDGSGTPRPRHGVRHAVETSGRPVFAKARRLDPEKHKIAEKEFRALEASGIVRRSNSPWASPLHMVPKSDGSWRPCGDYRRLNLITTHDKYPLPSILDLSAKLHGCKYFSCIDLVKGYHQVPMEPADIQKTAIITPFGLFEYLFMPFGLTNAAQTFQRLMDRLFGHLPFVFTYLDDHLIASSSLEEHLKHLTEFFQILHDNGLTINPGKCTFAVTSLKFLGHMVSETGLVPLPRHVAAIQNFPPPSSVKHLQQFLGLINFYRRFLPSIARTLKPLTDLLRGSPKTLEWPLAAAGAFVAAKEALVAAVPLSHPAPGSRLSLAVDASDTHVGGVLQQLENRSWRPLAFFSQKLSPTQVRYSTFDRELQAAFSTIRHFRFLLEGRRFQLLTDHKPLVAAMARVSPPWSARQQRQMAYISEFTSDFLHTPGAANVVADALSRPSALPSAPLPPRESGLKVSASPAAPLPPVAALRTIQVLQPLPPPPLTEAAVRRRASPLEVPEAPPRVTAPLEVPLAAVAAAQPVDFSEMAIAQRSCPDIVSMRASPSICVIARLIGEVMVIGDISTGVFRPFVPAAFREAVIVALHGIHHPGVRATVRLVSASFCWPHMGRLIASLARSCLGCQKGKVHRHIHLQPENIPVPQRRFSHIHVDLVGPLPRSDGFSHLFTIIDRTTRWPEAVPLSSTTAADCASALLSGWIQRFGVPAAITSDRGPQFTSSLWAALCKLLSISHVPTTAYHPQANGLVERFHRRLKDALRARAAGADWHSHLPWVMLGIRSAWREDSDFTPAEAVFGSQPILPGQFLSSTESPSPSFIKDFQGLLAARCPLPTAHHNEPGVQELPEELLLSRHVLVRRDGAQPPLSPAYDGPFLVLERSLRFFKLLVGTRQDTVSTLRLKACRSPPDVAVAVPPRRGRPAGAAQPAIVPEVVPPVPKKRGRPCRVSFACPAVKDAPTPPPPEQLFHPSGRPARSAGPPARLTISLVNPWQPRLGGAVGRVLTTF